MGKPSEAEIERNASLFTDYVSGNFNMVGLVTKYQISATRIYQIIKRQRAILSNKMDEVKLPIDNTLDK
jgi:Mor family transcriptional regulator